MSETPLDLAAIRARAGGATAGPWKTWAMSVLADPVGDGNLDTAILVANTVYRDTNGRLRTFDADFIAAARTDVPMLVDEVERLTRIVNGYDRTPAEQRATEAEAEVERLRAIHAPSPGGLDLAEIRRCYIPDMLEARNRERNQCDCNWPDSVSIDGDWLHVAGEEFTAALAEVESLRASNGQIRGDLERLRAENAGLLEREARRHSKFSQLQPRVSVLEILGCADAGGVGDPVHPSDPADCPVCRHALGLPEPVDGAGKPSVAPVAANGPGMAHGDTPQPDDAGEGQS